MHPGRLDMYSKGLALLVAVAITVATLLPSRASDEGGCDQRAEPRTVLFELFTSVNDTNCADDENATARLASEYGRRATRWPAPTRKPDTATTP